MTPFYLPTFIIGGAPRSGTTFLAQALARHPEVRMIQPFIPEPKILMGPEQSCDVYKERYRAYFAEQGAFHRGEKTSYYLEYPPACDRIHAVVPNVKLVFIVREPVARAYSNYLWTRKNGLEPLSFREAIALDGTRANPLPPEKAYANPFGYLDRGDYAALAEPYFQRFGRERVRFFLYEDIERRPEAMFEELQSFLELPAVPFEQLDVGVVNAARESGAPLDADMEAQLRERMSLRVRRFAEISGLDLSAWRYAA